MAPLHRFLSSIRRFLIAARHSAASFSRRRRENRRHIFYEATPRSIPQRALAICYSGLSTERYNVRCVSETDLKRYVKRIYFKRIYFKVTQRILCQATSAI
jgi:hypothetical protein